MSKVRWYEIKIEGVLEPLVVKSTSKSAFKRMHGQKCSLRRLTKREVREMSRDEEE